MSSSGVLEVEADMPQALLESEDFEQAQLDAVDEIRMRTWARTNYVPAEKRDDTWHPVVIEEMIRRDNEMYPAK